MFFFFLSYVNKSGELSKQFINKNWVSKYIFSDLDYILVSEHYDDIIIVLLLFIYWFYNDMIKNFEQKKESIGLIIMCFFFLYTSIYIFLSIRNHVGHFLCKEFFFRGKLVLVSTLKISFFDFFNKYYYPCKKLFGCRIFNFLTFFFFLCNVHNIVLLVIIREYIWIMKYFIQF